MSKWLGVRQLVVLSSQRCDGIDESAAGPAQTCESVQASANVPVAMTTYVRWKHGLSISALSSLLHLYARRLPQLPNLA